MSADGSNLTFSVALRPTEPRALWPRLALIAGLAVAEALDRLGVAAEVKWPNDVLIGGRKLCGILVEATDEHAVVGIGLNVGMESLPAELEETATSLRMEGRPDLSREEVLAMVLNALSGWSSEMGSGFDSVVAAVSQRWMQLLASCRSKARMIKTAACARVTMSFGQ